LREGHSAIFESLHRNRKLRDNTAQVFRQRSSAGASHDASLRRLRVIGACARTRDEAAAVELRGVETLFVA
jgi:hypothetical protein